MRKAINKNSKKRKKRVSRNGVILISLLALMSLVISLITMSYSWFTPAVKKATGMQYQADAAIRSEKCQIFKNYEGVKDPNDNNKLKYTTEVTGSQSISGTELKYFRTVIINPDENATNVSLYISSMPGSSDSDNPYGMGVASPSNSYHKYPSSQSDVYIVRNAYIDGVKDGVNGELIVDWFIKPNGNTISINLSGLYLMYN